jgi:hypothetical protein
MQPIVARASRQPGDAIIEAFIMRSPLDACVRAAGPARLQFVAARLP